MNLPGAMAAATDPALPPNDDGLQPGEHLFTLEEALVVAQKMHRAGHLPEAEKIYRAVLERQPGHPDALHFLGVLEHQRGDTEAAIGLIRRAIASMPGEPGPWNNLGNVFVETGRIDEAMQAYGRCLEIAPHFADTHNNVGTIHRLRNEWAASEASYQRAIAARPDFADAYNNLAKLMIAQRRIREGVTYACKAITLLPRDPEARKLLGIAYYTLGEIDKAAEVYREWLAVEPDNPVAVHHLAACSGEAVPERASDAYVARTFDALRRQLRCQARSCSPTARRNSSPRPCARPAASRRVRSRCSMPAAVRGCAGPSRASMRAS